MNDSVTITVSGDALETVIEAANQELANRNQNGTFNRDIVGLTADLAELEHVIENQTQLDLDE